MRPKSVILLMLALGCGLVAAIGIDQVMANRGDNVTYIKGETTPVFVALHQLGINDLIKPEDIKLEEWPKDKVPEGAISKLEDLEDRRVWTPIFPDEPILSDKLLEKGATTGGPKIPKGMRMVTVRVDDVVGLGGLLKPGDRVDLSVHVKANPPDVPVPVTKTFLQNVKVLAVGSETIRNKEGDQASNARTVSLLVSPDQVELVTQAAEIGSIRLSMRSHDDEEIADTGAASDVSEVLEGEPGNHKKNPLEGLMPKDNSMASLPTPPEPAPPPVVDTRNHFKMTVWEGDQAHTVEFIDGKPVAPLGDPGSSGGYGTGVSPAIPPMGSIPYPVPSSDTPPPATDTAPPPSDDKG